MDSWRDQLDQDLDCLRECTYVEEADEISLLIRRTVESQGLDAQIAYSRFRKIVSQLALLSHIPLSHSLYLDIQ